MTATFNEQASGTATGGATGRIARVIGPVIDAEFPADAMPAAVSYTHLTLPTIYSV